VKKLRQDTCDLGSRTTLLCERRAEIWRAEIWRAESIEEI
jgi:hypothetical protein